MNISQLWKLYEADKRIQGFSIQTLKAYALQLSKEKFISLPSARSG
jgi:hypothetical protein